MNNKELNEEEIHNYILSYPNNEITNFYSKFVFYIFIMK